MDKKFNKYKRLFIIGLFFFITKVAFADHTDIDYKGLKYDISTATNEATCKGLATGSQASGDLVIPDYIEYEGKQYPVTTIGNGAFLACSGFNGSLTIGNSVTKIGLNAFAKCTGFTGSLTIPNSVTTIENGAFQQCSGFNGSLTIPNSVTKIEGAAFYGCSGFTGSQTIPNSITTIENLTFRDCTGFTGSLTIPNSVTSIGEGAFYNCSGFNGSLTIGNSVTSIGLSAFEDCTGLTGSLKIPDSVTTIGKNAFISCEMITKIEIGNQCKELGYGAFAWSWKVSELIIGESVTQIGGECFNGDPITTIECNAITPPKLLSGMSTTFKSEIYKSCTLYVPSGSIEEYKNAEGWKDFKSISGINGTVVAPEPTEVTIEPKSLTLTEGETGQLTATLTPENAETTFTWSSSNTDVITIDDNGKVTAVKEGTATITVTTANRKTASATVTVSKNIIAVTGITVTPEIADILIGSTLDLTTTITPDDATDKSVNWTSSDTKIATVSEKGVVTGVAKGSVTITATASNGKTATATVTVRPLDPKGVTLSPSEMQLTEGGTGQFKVIFTPVNAESDLVWHSSDKTVAGVDENGLVTAYKEGTATIIVYTTYDKDMKASATVTVSKNIIEVTNITVTPSTAQIAIDSTLNLTASITPENATDKNVSWTSTDTKIATVSEKGEVKGIAKGTVTIIATSSNLKIRANSTVTVVAPQPKEVTITPTSLTLTEGETGQLTATLTPKNAESTLTWSSSNSTVATVDKGGNVTAVKEGTATITVTTANGKTASATVTVNKKIIEVTNITVTPPTAQIVIGSMVNLTASVTPENATDKSVKWSSSDAKIATVSEKGVVTGVAKGTVTITATTSNGKTATSTVTVVAPDPMNITLSPLTMTLSEGETGQFKVIYIPDNAESTLTWSSDDTSIAEVNNDGVVTAKNAGMTVISVKSKNGVTGMATVKVVNNQVTSISITPDRLNLELGETAQLKANVEPKTADSKITWTSGDSTVAVVNENGLVTATGKGATFIYATSDNGVTGIATVTVTDSKEVTSVTITPDNVEMVAGTEQQLQATVSPSTASQEITWVSSDTSVAEVSQEGVLSAISPGIAIIYAVSDNGLTGLATVTVISDEVTSVTITPDILTLELDETGQLTAVTEPAAVEAVLTWSSSDPTIATVDNNGTVKALEPGYAFIYAASDNGVTGVAIVKVTDPNAGDNPNLGYGDNGVYVSAIRIRQGDPLGLFAERPTGYQNNDWTYQWYLDGSFEAEGKYVIIPAGQDSGWSGSIKDTDTQNYSAHITNAIGNEVILELPEVKVYTRPLTPVELVRKGDGKSHTFIAMSQFTDTELANLGYSFVFGYTDEQGVNHIISNSESRYCNTTQAIYDNGQYRFWVYTTWTFNDGVTITSGLRYLDGEVDEGFDRSDFNFSRTSGVESVDDGEAQLIGIYTIEGRYVGKDIDRLAPGIYIIHEKKGNQNTTRKTIKK